MAAGDLQAPSIPDLIEGTVDPDALNGAPLKTYAKYPNPVLGDTLFQSWLGLDQNNDPVDITDIPIPVDPDNEKPEGFVMEVGNDLVHQLDNGQVFYSYFLERATGEPREESKRIHFSIGKNANLLPAPQIKESNDHQLDPNVVTDNITIAVPPYAVMSNGDEVILYCKGVTGGNEHLTFGPFRKVLNDSDNDTTNNPGQVLTWANITAANIRRLRGGTLTVHYEIIYASNARATSVSAERSLLITPPGIPELPEGSIKNLVGSEINPAQFPDGILCNVPIYQGIRVGDQMLVYGTRTGSGSAANKNTVQYLRIDKSNIESGKIEVPIGAQWLLDNVGGNVSVRYQYARPDAAGSGHELALSVVQPLLLPTPTVDKSVVANGRDELDPFKAISGAYITIPTAATIGDRDVTAYWKGFGESGSFETQTPHQFDPMKFKVPPKILPYNFNKMVEVTYCVDGQFAEPSLKLHVRPLDSHPLIVCDKAQIGSPATLKLSDIPDEGALVTVETWAFMSIEQTVRLWLTGGGVPDRDLIPPRSVKPEEITTGVTARLLKSDLSGIAINNSFTLRCSVIFDGGAVPVIFNKPLLLKLLA